MGLVLGDRSVLYALGHNEYFAWTQLNGAISQLNSDIPNEDQKEIVASVVFVPNEFALDLHNHEVMPVEATTRGCQYSENVESLSARFIAFMISHCFAQPLIPRINSGSDQS